MEAVKLDELNSPKKEAMIEALEKSLGIVSTAVKMAGISRGTHYELAQSRHGLQESGRLHSRRRSRLRRIAPL